VDAPLHVKGSFRTTEEFNLWLHGNIRKPLVIFALVYAMAVVYNILGMHEAAAKKMHLLMDTSFEHIDFTEAIGVAYTTT
jgi:hypothetical protein